MSEAALRQMIEQLQRDVAALAARSRSPLNPAVRVIVQTGHGFTIGQLIRHNGTSWVQSLADAAENAVIGGMVISVQGANTFTLGTPGLYVTGLSGKTAGAVHYLDETTPGGMTETAPALAVPVLLADSASSGVLLACVAAGGGTPPTEAGTVWASDTDGTAGEWVRDLDLGENDTGKAGKLRLLSPDAVGVAVEIDAALVPSAAKQLSIREVEECDAGVTKKRLILASALYT